MSCIARLLPSTDTATLDLGWSVVIILLAIVIYFAVIDD